jgi:hypothetical protein
MGRNNNITQIDLPLSIRRLFQHNPPKADLPDSDQDQEVRPYPTLMRQIREARQKRRLLLRRMLFDEAIRRTLQVKSPAQE